MAGNGITRNTSDGEAERMGEVHGYGNNDDSSRKSVQSPLQQWERSVGAHRVGPVFGQENCRSIRESGRNGQMDHSIEATSGEGGEGMDCQSTIEYIPSLTWGDSKGMYLFQC